MMVTLETARFHNYRVMYSEHLLFLNQFIDTLLALKRGDTTYSPEILEKLHHNAIKLYRTITMADEFLQHHGQPTVIHEGKHLLVTYELKEDLGLEIR